MITALRPGETEWCILALKMCNQSLNLTPRFFNEFQTTALAPVIVVFLSCTCTSAHRLSCTPFSTSICFHALRHKLLPCFPQRFRTAPVLLTASPRFSDTLLVDLETAKGTYANRLTLRCGVAQKCPAAHFHPQSLIHFSVRPAGSRCGRDSPSSPPYCACGAPAP